MRGVFAALLGSVVVSAFDNEKRIKEIYDAEPCPAGNEVYKKILWNLHMKIKEVPTHIYNVMFEARDLK